MAINIYVKLDTRKPYKPEAAEMLRAVSDPMRLQQILEQGVVHPDSAKPGDDTALIVAASKGNEKAVELLLAAGADPNLAGKEGRSPLRAAIDGRNLACVECILAAGADPAHISHDRRFGINCTDANYATSHGDFDIATAVCVVSDRYTVLLDARVSNDIDVLIADMKPEHIDLVDEYGGTILLYACNRGLLNVAATALEMGADPRKAHKYDPDTTPLTVAQAAGHRAVEELVLRHLRKLDDALSMRIPEGVTPVVPMRLKRPGRTL